ncbi:MAG: hypothetical protein ACK5N0_14320 [Synechococcaceae cyanobacterium]
MPSSGRPEGLRQLGWGLARRWGPPLAAWLLPAAFVALITLLARWLHTPTVLFPELAALAAVVLLQPQAPWSQVPLQLALAPFLTAGLGQLCLWLLPWWPPTVLLAVALSISLVRWLRSPLVPALSCGLGPWAFQLHSWSFAPSLLVGTGLLALVCLLRPGAGVPVPGRMGPDPHETALAHWLPVYGVFLVLGLVLVALTGQRLILYPPLLVIAYEGLVHPRRCPWRGRPLATVLGCTVAAGIGTLLAGAWGVTPLATALTVVLLEAWQRLLRLRLLPAFGAGLLPFLLPQPNLSFPLSVALGTGLWALVSQLAGPGNRSDGTAIAERQGPEAGGDDRQRGSEAPAQSWIPPGGPASV